MRIAEGNDIVRDFRRQAGALNVLAPLPAFLAHWTSWSCACGVGGVAPPTAHLPAAKRAQPHAVGSMSIGRRTSRDRLTPPIAAPSRSCLRTPEAFSAGSRLRRRPSWRGPAASPGAPLQEFHGGGKGRARDFRQACAASRLRVNRLRTCTGRRTRLSRPEMHDAVRAPRRHDAPVRAHARPREVRPHAVRGFRRGVGEGREGSRFAHARASLARVAGKRPPRPPRPKAPHPLCTRAGCRTCARPAA